MKNLELVGNELGYNIFRNGDGFLEGYRKKGKGASDDLTKDCERIATNQTTVEGFCKYIRGLRSKNVTRLKPSQLPQIPFTDL